MREPSRIPAGSLAELAGRQQQVARRDQLRAASVTPGWLRAQLTAGRWQELGPVLVVMHNGPLTRPQQLWAAVLDAGPRAALCGRTAAAADGLAGWEDDVIHVLVRRGDRPSPLPGLAIRVHESRRYEEARDRHPSRTPPRTRLERSLVDAAVWSRSERTACGLVVAGVQQRITRAERLTRELQAAGRVRHHRLLLQVLHDVAGGAQALSELDFARFCRRHRLPEPERQVVRRDPDGRRRYLDAVLRRRDGVAVAVEIDGAVHLVAETYWSDMARGNEVVIGGDRLLRFPRIALDLDELMVADQLRRALWL